MTRKCSKESAAGEVRISLGLDGSGLIRRFCRVMVRECLCTRGRSKLRASPRTVSL